MIRSKITDNIKSVSCSSAHPQSIESYQTAVLKAPATQKAQCQAAIESVKKAKDSVSFYQHFSLNDLVINLTLQTVIASQVASR